MRHHVVAKLPVLPDSIVTSTARSELARRGAMLHPHCRLPHRHYSAAFATDWICPLPCSEDVSPGGMASTMEGSARG